MRLILASVSTGRKELLETLKIPFEVMRTNVDEEKIVDRDPVKMACRRAKAKAEDALSKIQGNWGDMGNKGNKGKIVIIGADTVGFLDSWVFGKPKSRAEAVQMLQKLSGKTHKYVSAHTFIKILSNTNQYYPILTNTNKNQKSVKPCNSETVNSETVKTGKQFSNITVEKIVDYDVASVTLRSLTQNEISFYLDRVPYQKLCGGLQIMGSPQNFVTKIEGSLSTVIGLSLEKIIPILQKEI